MTTTRRRQDTILVPKPLLFAALSATFPAIFAGKVAADLDKYYEDPTDSSFMAIEFNPVVNTAISPPLPGVVLSQVDTIRFEKVIFFDFLENSAPQYFAGRTAENLVSLLDNELDPDLLEFIFEPIEVPLVTP